MKNRLLVVSITLAALAVLVILLLSGSWGGMMGPGWGMMGGWGFGWIGMLFTSLIPVGFVVLTVLGLAWLVRSGYGVPPPSVQHYCVKCRGKVTDDARFCPNCGTPLE